LLKHWVFYTTPKLALVQKPSRINLYNPLALSVLLYGSETQTLRENGKKNIIPDEISRKSYGIHTFDQEKNLETVIKVETEPVEEKLRRYKSNWLIHIKRTTKNICQK
jgi:hypothetical protein